MSVFRLCFVWLVMLALPLQGLAAASMQYCGGKGDAAVVAAPQEHAAAVPMAHQGHDGHDHSAHQGHADADATEAGTQDQTQAGGHTCVMCAFCGHGVALSQALQPLAFGEPAHASPPEPSVRIPAIAVLVPDKPPRA